PHPSALALFPCTTLFRSERIRLLVGGAAVVARDRRRYAVGNERAFERGEALDDLVGDDNGVSAGLLRDGQRDGGRLDSSRQPDRDRKSTRLNSSHVKISY